MNSRKEVRRVGLRRSLFQKPRRHSTRLQKLAAIENVVRKVDHVRAGAQTVAIVQVNTFPFGR